MIAGLSKESQEDPDYAVRCGWSIYTHKCGGPVEACPLVAEILARARHPHMIDEVER